MQINQQFDLLIVHFVAEHHPQFWLRPGRDGPLPLCPPVSYPESPGASHEDASGLLQPGEQSRDESQVKTSANEAEYFSDLLLHPHTSFF